MSRSDKDHIRVDYDVPLPGKKEPSDYQIRKTLVREACNKMIAACRPGMEKPPSVLVVCPLASSFRHYLQTMGFKATEKTEVKKDPSGRVGPNDLVRVWCEKEIDPPVEGLVPVS